MNAKLTMPKHTGKKVDFDSALKVCYEVKDAVPVDKFKTALFSEFKAIGKEKKRKQDGSHYTKCAQLPKYFGFISQVSKEAPLAITASGISYYEAVKNDDKEKQVSLILEAIKGRTFGRDNEGVFTCNSDCEPIGVLFRMLYDLNEISRSEYGYVLQCMHTGTADYEKSIKSIKRFRKAKKDPPIKAKSIAANIKDWKTVNFLQELGVLERHGKDKVMLAKPIDEKYHNMLIALPVVNTGVERGQLPDAHAIDLRKYSPEEMENMFVRWLTAQPSQKGKGSITTYAAKNYAAKLRLSLLRVPFQAIACKNLYQIVGLDEYLPIKKQIEHTEGFKEFDKAKANGNGYFSKALKYYERFLSDHPNLPMLKLLANFQGALSDAKLSFAGNLVRRFVAAQQAKPFVILTGLSGSGKTKLAEAFTRWLCGRQRTHDALSGKDLGVDNVKLVSVGADWTNSEKLLGYPDALHEGKYIMPDTGVLQFILQAKKDELAGVPYFLILDEMNLSHVERYFADFLSAMESVDRVVNLHDVEAIEKNGVPRTLALPKNLFVVGTMNVDETTYMFSPKVLDRAQVIEFRVDKAEMLAYLEGSDRIDLDKLCDENGRGLGESFAASFFSASQRDYPAVSEAKDALAEFFPHLAKLGSEFGFRTASEFRRFVSIYVAAGGSPSDAVDFAIMQKLLPKLHGSKRKLGRPLQTLWELCQIDPKNPTEMPSVEKEDDFDFEKECRYKVSAKKILRMVRALDVGFASFAEA